jgi:hypothetical protein
MTLLTLELSCAVCLSDIPLGSNVFKTTCQHVFHPGCIADWLNSHNSCPLCRTPI